MAVERIKEYSETPTEAPPIVESRRPPEDWPPEGHVKFDHYSTRYREGLDLVLKDIDVDIPGGTKVYTSLLKCWILDLICHCPLRLVLLVVLVLASPLSLSPCSVSLKQWAEPS